MNSNQESDIEYLRSEDMKEFPLSEAVRVGKMLYLSGQIGVDASLRLVAGGMAEKTRQSMENIRAILERYDSSLDNVVKVTVMLADIDEWAEMNKVYINYFPKRLPARSAFGAKGLALGASVEIECVAVLDDYSSK